MLHTDAALLPRDRKAWAAWNAFIPRTASEACTVSYCMNLLQGLDRPGRLSSPSIGTAGIDPAKILRRMHYHHPVYTHASVAAQSAGRNPGPQAHLVRGRLLGLGIPRRRHAQRGRGGARSVCTGGAREGRTAAGAGALQVAA